ncbi:hypothetical protein ASPZODRAFT_28170 [Penicilliopsis zonata CBS 506.65]|uniref:Amino acid transporter transmembrane domain-containing protein n=1 Tax=Penicilliopsis zonata CBS 506.65 TaxID=1073090 RepID=A0A1L9S8K1_9EURO|nr:hypothetical protein ASPZODRAFT_28170 [Penicilliopsis zonata CBS 506.65]OJJ43491.1 hypothetical protein ASPZODRAFT_28170 [Penicilliopsis zonata CBS 506.65]
MESGDTKEIVIEPCRSNGSPDEGVLEEKGVFRHSPNGPDFRAVSWQRATIIFLKIQFAMSILSVPESLATLGAVGGALSIVGWEVLNTYTAVILGEFRNRHPECHTLSDMCGVVLPRVGRELVGIQILVAQVIITAAGIVSISTAFNALSHHSTCTVAFNAIAAILITRFSSIRTLAHLGWITWVGFATFFIAIFIFVMSVTQLDRPVGAPATGEFDLGWIAIASPTFTAGMLTTANIFISSSRSSMYLPVISEMRRPSKYQKAALLAGAIIRIATPAFGSGGPLFKKLCYGLALPGLVIGVGIYQHVAAKLIFVRLLRDSHHLQENTAVHWITWLGANLLLGVLGFVIAEAVPILNYLLGLAGSLCFAPFSLMYPAMLWMYDFRAWRHGTKSKQAIYWLHAFIILLGGFMVIGGTYSVAVTLREAYADGSIGKPFSCADNSGS